jgi:hypothetical protein
MFTISDNLVLAVNKYFTWRATAEMVNEKVGAIKTRVLLSGDFRTDKGERITDYKQDYKLYSGNDAEAGGAVFTDYLQRLNIEYRLAGYNVSVAYCPALIADSNARDAKREFVGVFLADNPQLGVTIEKILLMPIQYKKIIELVLTLVVNVDNFQTVKAV